MENQKLNRNKMKVLEWLKNEVYKTIENTIENTTNENNNNMKYTKGNLVLTSLGGGKIVDFIPGTLGKYIHYKVKLHNKQVVWVTEENYKDFERPYIIKKMGCKPFLELSIDNAIKLLKDNGYLISKVV